MFKEYLYVCTVKINRIHGKLHCTEYKDNKVILILTLTKKKLCDESIVMVTILQQSKLTLQ